ncbi:GNAT family N-acetyltransferase [Ferrimonas balearica]|uniref:GNAT family N-acetyltransferase n=1 Tax=Ferrimonas balearica TaxID=44012 RepID=UPI001C9A15F2|nr:GNAT family N-acetyltransferase [Ferrimonas balearica]MBY5991792.1 GNAT family N-acetyltransferase [Ferrimonas balearica]
MTPLTIKTVDYHHPKEVEAMVGLLDAYARDPMGGGTPLAEPVKRGLGPALANEPGALSLIAYDGAQPVGLLNAFRGFSTFQCKPLMNVHDVVVLSSHRGRGVSMALLEALERQARAMGCAKLTLEVLEGNSVARNAYRKFGFAGYELDPAMGQAQFWQKVL